MSEPTTVFEAERSMRCTRCGAEPGAPCETVAGNPTGHHTARWYAARKAGLLPLRRPCPNCGVSLDHEREGHHCAPPVPEGAVEGGQP